MSPFVPGGVSDGQWHTVQLKYYNKVGMGGTEELEGPVRCWVGKAVHSAGKREECALQGTSIPLVVLDGGNMCKARLSLLGCLLPSFSVHSRCWVRQDFHKAHLSRRWLWCPWMAVTQGWLCASELCWATTPVLPRAPKEAARSKQRWGGGGGRVQELGRG